MIQKLTVTSNSMPKYIKRILQFLAVIFIVGFVVFYSRTHSTG